METLKHIEVRLRGRPFFWILQCNGLASNPLAVSRYEKLKFKLLNQRENFGKKNEFDFAMWIRSRCSITASIAHHLQKEIKFCEWEYTIFSLSLANKATLEKSICSKKIVQVNWTAGLIWFEQIFALFLQQIKFALLSTGNRFSTTKKILKNPGPSRSLPVGRPKDCVQMVLNFKGSSHTAETFD